VAQHTLDAPSRSNLSRNSSWPGGCCWRSPAAAAGDMSARTPSRPARCASTIMGRPCASGTTAPAGGRGQRSARPVPPMPMRRRRRRCRRVVPPQPRLPHLKRALRQCRQRLPPRRCPSQCRQRRRVLACLSKRPPQGRPAQPRRWAVPVPAGRGQKPTSLAGPCASPPRRDCAETLAAADSAKTGHPPRFCPPTSRLCLGAMVPRMGSLPGLGRVQDEWRDAFPAQIGST
jgi:hypothetical protein